MKPIVTVTNVFPEKALKKLSPHCDLRTNQTENPISISGLEKIASESVVMVTYLSDKIDAGIIDKGQNLKLIANYGAGFNNIDVGHAAGKKIWVTNTPGVLHETTADLTWAMIWEPLEILFPQIVSPVKISLKDGRQICIWEEMFLARLLA